MPPEQQLEGCFIVLMDEALEELSVGNAVSFSRWNHPPKVSQDRRKASMNHARVHRLAAIHINIEATNAKAVFLDGRE